MSSCKRILYEREDAKMLKFNTFKSRTILYFSLLICISLILLGTISYATFSNFTKNEMIKSTSIVTAQVNNSLDMYLNEIKDSLNFISINPIIISTIHDSISSRSQFDQTQNRSIISVLLNNIFAEKTDIKGYFIYNYEHQIQFINSNRNIEFNSPFLQKVWNDFRDTPYALKTKFYGAHKPDYYDNYSNATDQNVITIAANIKDAYDPSNPTLYGVALFDYNINKLKTIFDTIKSELNLDAFVIDNEQQIIYQTNPVLFIDDAKKQRLYEKPSGYWIDSINGDNMLISYTTSSVTGWKIVSLLSFHQLNQKLSLIHNSTLLLICVMIVITVIFSTALTIRTTKPIITLVQFMKEVSKGKLDIRINRDSPYEEMNVLNRGINNMLDKINELISDLVKRQLLQKETEYAVLQAKVNPHFLYNTLQSITSLSILERNHDIQIVTYSLRDLLQYSLYRQNEMVLMKEEINCVQNYLRIQNIRYDGRLDYSFQVDEAALHCQINKFILQPIIENAIYHGLEGKDGRWELNVRINSDPDQIRIEIQDNGIGMAKQRLIEVQEQLVYKEIRSGRIGLPNIMDRLVLKFGLMTKMEINSTQGVGTSIIITIPKSTNAEGSTDDKNTSY
jgi:sensor histidine kinase YesM